MEAHRRHDAQRGHRLRHAHARPGRTLQRRPLRAHRPVRQQLRQRPVHLVTREEPAVRPGPHHHEGPVSYGVRGFYALVWDYIMPVPAFIDGSPPGFIQRRGAGPQFPLLPARVADRISSRATSTPTPTRPATNTRTWIWPRSAAAICSPRCSVWTGSRSTAAWPTSAARTGTP